MFLFYSRSARNFRFIFVLRVYAPYDTPFSLYVVVIKDNAVICRHQYLASVRYTVMSFDFGIYAPLRQLPIYW